MALDMNAAVKITASVNGQSAVDQLRNSMDKMSSSAAGMAKTFAAGFIGFQAIQGVATFAKSVLDTADQMDEMAQRTGLTVEQLSELDYAAKLSGTSLDAVQTAMGKLAAKAVDATTGNKTAAVAFEALGISVKNSNGSLKSQLQLFEEVGAQIAEIRDPTLRAAMAIEVFGKSGAQLLPLLQDMGALRKEARELGGVIGSDFAASAAAFNDNLDRMTLMSKGLAKAILNDVLPSINSMMTEMIVGMKVFGSFGSAMWNVGTTNPFNTLQDNAKKYNDEVARLEAQIKRTASENKRWSSQTLSSLNSQLDTAKKLAEYFNTMVEKQNPQQPTPQTTNTGADGAARRALDIMSRSRTTTVQLTDAQREAKRMEQERAQILLQLSDSVLKLKEGEEGLTIEKLKRLGASQTELQQAEALIAQQGILNEATENQKQKEKDAAEARRRLTAEAEENFARLEEQSEQFARTTQSVWDDTRTPLERYLQKLKELEELKAQGGITDDTATRAMNKAREDLMQQTGYTFDDSSTKMARYAAQLREIEELHRNGAITSGEMQIAIKGLDDDFKSLGRSSTDIFKEMQTAMLGFARSSADAIVDFVSGAETSFSKLAESILKDLARLAVYKTITEPLFNYFGSFLPTPVTASANGNVFNGGSLQAFANGGIVGGPTLFPMANGTGLMGEAGPEAIMPLRRTPSGKLGIISQGGGSTNNVTVNVNVESGQSQTDGDSAQAEKLGGYITKAVQAELMKQKRPGGVLFAGA